MLLLHLYCCAAGKLVQDNCSLFLSADSYEDDAYMCTKSTVFQFTISILYELKLCWHVGIKMPGLTGMEKVLVLMQCTWTCYMCLHECRTESGNVVSGQLEW